MLYTHAYLSRIAYTGSTEPTAETLRRLHRAHLFNVPFENLDIGLKRPIVCDQGAFLRKIVEKHRGGFCYELNGAFAALLGALGFRVTLLSARVPRDDGSESPEFDHLTLRVDLTEPWLADVGFGDSFLDPLRLIPGIEQEQQNGKFRISQGESSVRVEKLSDGNWKAEYSFTLQPRALSEFADMCHYHQTSPRSSFTQKRVCTRATPDGRITLADRKLIVTRNGVREERSLNGEDEWRAELLQHFGVVL
jgi:N-hydroxyarylamine O-acetyltransferase